VNLYLWCFDVWFYVLRFLFIPTLVFLRYYEIPSSVAFCIVDIPTYMSSYIGLELLPIYRRLLVYFSGGKINLLEPKTPLKERTMRYNAPGSVRSVSKKYSSPLHPPSEQARVAYAWICIDE
jgi:hypothetical protein